MSTGRRRQAPAKSARVQREPRASGGPKKRGLVAVLLALLVLVAVIGGGILLLLRLVSGLHSTPQGADYPGPGAGTVLVHVKSGQTAGDIATTLKASGVVQSRTAFLQAASGDPRSTKIQPGYYTLRKEMKASDALSLIVDGTGRAEKKVLIREGMRVKDTFAALSKGTGIPLADFEALQKSPGDLGLPDYANAQLEGFLFPATYEFPPNATAKDVLRELIDRYKLTAKKLGIGSGETQPFDTVVIASMLEAEVNNAEDYGKAARVVENRLAIKEPLGFDSALHYYVGDNRRLTTKLLQTNTPYNLRKFAGLPPTPISSPGEATLKAALNPTPGDWRWFLTIDPKTGKTLFFNNYNDFVNARNKYNIHY